MGGPGIGPPIFLPEGILRLARIGSPGSPADFDRAEQKIGGVT